MSSRMIGSVLALAMAVGGAPQASQRLTPPAVPQEIAAEGYTPFLAGRAIGTQNYICATAPTQYGFEWLFIGPQETVFDTASGQLMTHFQSMNPDENDAIHATWQHSKDTSAVWAKRRSGSTDPAYVSPDAIEWLLLEVSGRAAGPGGGDRLLPAVLIQRVNTVGGLKPPTAECGTSTLGKRRLVPYEADYYFYR